MNASELNRLLRGKERRRLGQSSGAVLAMDALRTYLRRGGRWLFWACPNKCAGQVTWKKIGEEHVATCEVCKTKSGRLKPKGGARK